MPRDTVSIEAQVEIDLPGGTTTWFSFDGLSSATDSVAIHFGGDISCISHLRIHSSCVTGDVFAARSAIAARSSLRLSRLCTSSGAW